MALFRKKTPEDGNGDSGDNGKPDFEPQPEKARKWFDAARTMADSFSYDSALVYFANGIRFDPEVMSAHESMYDVALRYISKGGKPASSREVKTVDDGTPVGRFAAAEFEWMKDLTNLKSALRAIEAAARADQIEVGNWMAPKILNLVQKHKKLNKGLLVQAMNLFRDVGAWDESLTAGEMARQLDPSDNDLATEVKNLSAQRAMDQGGYADAVGQEGGFRKFIKDADKQAELLDEETLAGGATVEQRNLLRAKKAIETNPNDSDAINRFAQLLKKQGTLEAVQAARDVYLQGYENTGEYRFRMAAGDISIELLEAELRAVEAKLQSSPDDADLLAQRVAAKTRVLELKIAEYEDRVKKYPTDRFRKYDLGLVYLELGKYGDAMAMFQAAKDEPKLRVRAGYMLGRSFLADGLVPEAIAELEDALHAIDATERDREQAIRYDLMLALMAGAREENSIDLAKQAKTICSDIARKDITYRDILARRKEIDALIKELGG